MMETESFALDVANEMPSKGTVKAVPLVVILALVQALLPVIMQCFPNNPEGAARFLSRAGPIRRWKIRREVAARYDGSDLAEVQEAVIEACGKVTPQRMVRAYRQA